MNSTRISSFLTAMSWNINCYLTIFLLIFGGLGNLLNIFVLSQRTLRSNSCAWLFRISSIFNLISILFGLTTRLISNSILDRYDFLCQLRVFILLTSRTIAIWLISLAIFDRWLLSCVKVSRRRLSTLKNIKQVVTIIVLSIFLIFSPIFYCYQGNLIDSPLKCYSKTIFCRILTDQIYTFVTILFPLIFMIVFGFLTMHNVRNVHSRALAPFLSRSSLILISYEQRQHLKSVDRRLLIMLLIQIGFLVLFTLPQTIEMIYLTITTNRFKSSIQKTIENSIFTFTILLTYVASGMPFYIYTLSGGRVFRQGVSQFFRQIKSVMC